MNQTELSESYRKRADRIVVELREAYSAGERHRVRELEDEIRELEQEAKWDQLAVDIVPDLSVPPRLLDAGGEIREFLVSVTERA